MQIAADTQALEVQGLAEPECSEAILRAFDELAPGESLVVTGDYRPGELLRRLQVERKGLFEWTPLETCPPRLRSVVARRAAEPGALRGVCESLAWDHDRLDALEGRAFELLAATDSAGAVLAWDDFTAGLKRHIRFEEELLFPAFERETGLSPEGGPTGVMRSEHREIEALLEEIGRGLAAGAEVLHLRRRLQRLLGEHNLKEERVVYPATDRALGPEAADALVVRIQSA